MITEEATLEDVMPLIIRLSRFFATVNSELITEEQALSASSIGFIIASRTFNERMRTSFQTWLELKVKGALRDERRKLIRLAKRDERIFEKLKDNGHPDHKSYESFVDSLSAHARTVVQIATQQPDPFDMILSGLGEKTPANMRQTIRIMLKRRKWSKQTITKTFKEIRDAIRRSKWPLIPS